MASAAIADILEPGVIRITPTGSLRAIVVTSKVRYLRRHFLMCNEMSLS
jgi:hypothetical protein